MSDPRVEVIDAALADEPVLRNLLELYMYDFSEFNGSDVDEEGVFGYRHLAAYWTDADRRPFLFRVDGKWSGFALVRVGSAGDGTPNDMAEFFVMRKYRRGGIGIEAARAVFERVPGEWQVRQMAANSAATSFWRRAIPVAFEETTNDMGPVQRFALG